MSITTLDNLDQDMPRIPKAEDLLYGEAKKQKQFLITDTASRLIDEAAESLNISRSELIERVARSGRLVEIAQPQRGIES